ncbi:hypothetical protein [Xenorhabdus bovienii]|nr:hypothetical protein [Xenorhabdus bovienii]
MSGYVDSAIGKHICVQAFRDQVKNEHDVVGKLSDMMDELSKG